MDKSRSSIVICTYACLKYSILQQREQINLRPEKKKKKFNKKLQEFPKGEHEPILSLFCASKLLNPLTSELKKKISCYVFNINKVATKK